MQGDVMRACGLVVFFLGACSEYDLTLKPDDALPGDTGTGTDTVDEGECSVEEAPAGSVTIDKTCLAPDVVVDAPWDVRIEWQWSQLSTNASIGNAIMMPTVGNLTDDNGDGVIDEEDTPDIALVAFASSSISTGTLVVLDGATGTEHYSRAGWDGGGGIAMADVNGDGETDIVGFDSSRRPQAVRADGSPLWTSSVTVPTTYPQATVADLDGDGVPEVIAHNLVLDGATGALETTLSLSSGIPYTLPAAGDLDLDGQQEVIIGNTVFRSNGSAMWSAPFAGGYGHWSAILDADGDPEAEVAMVGGGYFGVFNHDGSTITHVAAGTGQPGPPCVADFDGDGDAEIAWASSSQMNLYELSGAQVWSMPVNDSSGLAGCSGYDADGDGVYEVLFADQDTFYIFDGATGAVRYEQGGHASGTLWEYPAVADVDNDGSAEIIIASNNYYISGWSGVTVFGHRGDGWQKSGSTWHVHDFAVSNINPDGTVPASPSPSWQLYNVYRARPAVDTAALDLRVSIVDACWSGCAGADTVYISAQLANTGGADVTVDVPISLYSADGTLLSAKIASGGLLAGPPA
jgi:hypothetical protein